MFFKGRKDTQIALHTPIVVTADVICDHLDQFMFACKTLSIITLALQDAPEPLHRSVVDALSHAGHTLRHSCLLQLVMESSARILETAIGMEDGVSIGVGLYGLVKGLKNKRMIVAVSNNEGNNATVIQVQNSAQIDLVDLNTFVPFEFRHIGQPLFVGSRGVEFTVQHVLCNILRTLRLPRTAVIVVLDSRFNVFLTADSECSFIVDVDVVVVAEIVVNAAITLVRAFHMDLLNFFCNSFVLYYPDFLPDSQR